MGLGNKAKQKEIIFKVIAMIEDGQREIQFAIDSIPEKRLPSKKIKKSIQDLRESTEIELNAVGVDLSKVKELGIIDDLEIQSRRATLQRYSLLISKDKDITPYATFYELHKAFSGTPQSGIEEVKEAYNIAVRALFTHPEIANALIVRLEKNSQILGEEGDRHTNSHRNRIELFLENYEELSKHNPDLAKNKDLESVMLELEAIVFLQEQAVVLNSGEKYASEEFIDYINYWAGYLSELPEEEQMKRYTIIQAVETCSALNNATIDEPEFTVEG